MNAMNAEAYKAFLCDRREQLLSRIALAAQRAGRQAQEVSLLAVSKTVGVEEVMLAREAGYCLFGENRPQELRNKVSALQGLPEFAGVRFDMIGNLQTNKINQVLGNATLIHSVSTVHLAEAIARRAQARGTQAKCLLEVNVSGEESKSGFAPQDMPRVAEYVMGLEGFEFEGLMTMAPANNASAARATFNGLRELRDELRVRTGVELPVLSCGMSGDFEIAVEEGSTLVRLGRITFDPAYTCASD